MSPPFPGPVGARFPPGALGGALGPRAPPRCVARQVALPPREPATPAPPSPPGPARRRRHGHERKAGGSRCRCARTSGRWPRRRLRPYARLPLPQRARAPGKGGLGLGLGPLGARAAVLSPLLAGRAESRSGGSCPTSRPPPALEGGAGSSHTATGAAPLPFALRPGAGVGRFPAASRPPVPSGGGGRGRNVKGAFASICARNPPTLAGGTAAVGERALPAPPLGPARRDVLAAALPRGRAQRGVRTGLYFVRRAGGVVPCP